MRTVSFAIPCYGSEHTITNVINEVIATVTAMKFYDYEIIAVNDYSPDNVWQVLESLAQSDLRIKIINLTKNMGKHAAQLAALNFASGDIIVCMDDDGQCPANELPRLISELDNGYDVAIAKFKAKKQSLFKNFGSELNNKIASFMLKSPSSLKFSNFCAMKKFVRDEIVKYSNPYPYLEGLVLRTTHNIAMVPMEDRDRFAGKSNFTLYKSISLFLNGFTAFSVKPLRIASVMGLIFSLVGFIFCIVLIIRKLLEPEIIAGYSSTMAVLIFIGGILMCMLGLIGEYVGRIYISINNSPQYVIKEKINID